ncbi:hypothetical protein QQF64_017201 [Cirrhinus molitorella]|uniref:Uncharacterized protein n=1 Tax=Cirrhinus molitorella TaxID=172907 RepID=A0ABR3LI05_9TELE
MCGGALNDEFLYSLDYFLFWRALAPRAMAAALLPQEVGSDQLMERNLNPSCQALMRLYNTGTRSDSALLGTLPYALFDREHVVRVIVGAESKK